KVYLSLLILSVVGITIVGHYGAMLTHDEEYLTEVLPGKQHNLAEKNGASMVLLASLGESLSDDQVAALDLEVAPILADYCYNWHGGAKRKGDFRLDSRDAIMAGGESGPAVVPGKPEKSELIRRISLPAGHKEVMPSKGKLLSSDEVEVL